MAIPLSAEGDPLRHTLRITIEGAFTFGASRSFLDALDECRSDSCLLVIDLEHTDYIDSAAIGLLIQAEIRLAPQQAVVRVRRGSAADRALALTNFSRRFAVEAA
jgi:anti-anti-sigma regulatory factor